MSFRFPPRAWRLAASVALALIACGGSASNTMQGESIMPSLVTQHNGMAIINDNVVSTGFTASDEDFPNPERGFLRWAWTTLDALVAADLQDAYANGYRIVYAPLRLDPWRHKELPASLLTKLTQSFAVARAQGVKLLIRAQYNSPDGDYATAKDASLSRVLGHIGQLKPLLQKNADVIAFMQAGFIGAWGEWHTSSNKLLGESSRTQIRDALLDALPATRALQVRNPAYLIDWTPALPGLSSALAGDYRVGMHNDCFLASPTDMGSYADDATQRATQQAYVAALGDLAPFGGETCTPDAVSEARTSCADILAEGARYRLSYLNDEFYRDAFHANWIGKGCMAEVRRSMGYRIRLLSASHVATAHAGQGFALELELMNVGWARIYNPRDIQILLRNRSSAALTRLDASGTDPRSWLPGAKVSAKLALTLPADLAAGSYDLLLALPDPAASLSADARYAIRPANADDSSHGQQWDAMLGAFALGSRLQVE